MLNNTLRNSIYWIRLTKESYESISKEFSKKPSISTFGEYFVRDNLV